MVFGFLHLPEFSGNGLFQGFHRLSKHVYSLRHQILQFGYQPVYFGLLRNKSGVYLSHAVKGIDLVLLQIIQLGSLCLQFYRFIHNLSNAHPNYPNKFCKEPDPQ